MATQKNIIILSDDGKTHRPIPAGDTLDPTLIPMPITPVSTDAGNYIRPGTGDNRAYLDGNDVLSNGGENALEINPVDGKIYLNPNKLGGGGGGPVDVTVVSGDRGNVIIEGSDGGAMLRMAGLISSDNDNQIVRGTDNRLFTAKPVAVSSDAENVLISGSDGGASLRMAGLISSDNDNQIVQGTDNRLFTAKPVVVSSDAGNVLISGSDGGASLPLGSAVSADEGNAIVVGTDDRLFVPATKDVEYPAFVPATQGLAQPGVAGSPAAYTNFDTDPAWWTPGIFYSVALAGSGAHVGTKPSGMAGNSNRGVSILCTQLSDDAVASHVVRRQFWFYDLAANHSVDVDILAYAPLYCVRLGLLDQDTGLWMPLPWHEMYTGTYIQKQIQLITAQLAARIAALETSGAGV